MVAIELGQNGLVPADALEHGHQGVGEQTALGQGRVGGEHLRDLFEELQRGLTPALVLALTEYGAAAGQTLDVTLDRAGFDGGAQAAGDVARGRGRALAVAPAPPKIDPTHARAAVVDQGDRHAVDPGGLAGGGLHVAAEDQVELGVELRQAPIARQAQV